MRSKQQNEIIISSAMPLVLAERLRKEARRDGRTVSALVRRIVQAWASWEQPSEGD